MHGTLEPMRFVLVHSPLVGPATWRWVADALVRTGHEVTVPDLTTAALTGDPHAFVEVARRSTPIGSCVVAGHSGAGFFLPSIAADVDAAARRLVFVDAVMPPCGGAAAPSADFLDRLRELAVDGVLPRWSTWWGEGAMARLVLDPDRRAVIEAELPEIPLSFYESEVAIPIGWCERLAGYLLLSEAYRDDARIARGRGWRVAERLAGHLDIVNDAEVIARELVALA